MKNIVYCLAFIFLISCNTESSKEKTSIDDISTKEITEFKVLDSENLSLDTWKKNIETQLEGFGQKEHDALASIILEADILALNKAIGEGKLNYESLTKFYLYRILKYDRGNDLSLNSVISIAPDVVAQAKQKDLEVELIPVTHLLFGMPILLKDNINTNNLPTTAGAIALQGNQTANDAYIVKQLKNAGAIILGKANLSEWAYFFCGECPSGYSAVGGQTLNPYGRKIIDTGGSSSGSGVAVAANLCVAAIGTETSGSILSPSSQNSLVGLKPTIGLLSRSGIVPISSTLDTPGPMTKTVTDNAIVLSALYGYDKSDLKSVNPKWDGAYYTNLLSNSKSSVAEKRFGVFKGLLKDTLYANAAAALKKEGAILVEIEAAEIDLPNFLNLLNLDMKKDLPDYFKHHGAATLGLSSVEDVIAFNAKDSVKAMPYGQKLFHGIVADTATEEEFSTMKATLKENGKQFFDMHMNQHELDAILSINNYHAGYAAVAEYPALTVPMGYMNSGEPKGLTFISFPFKERDLLAYAYAFEQATKHRKSPKGYN